MPSLAVRPLQLEVEAQHGVNGVSGFVAEREAPHAQVVAIVKFIPYMIT
jgi:hypothetical protein